MKKQSCLLALMLLAVPLVTAAGPNDLPTKTSGFYLGVGAGYAKIDTDNGAISVGGEDFSYRALSGYRFAHIPLPLNIDLGLEAAYVDFGEVDEQTLGTNISVELSGIAVSGIVYLPLTRHFDVFGKAGAYFWDGKVSIDGAEAASEDGTDLSFGLGIDWQTGSSFGARLEVESLDALDGVWVTTLSATYQFK